MACVLCCFLLVGIVQTFVLKSKQSNLNSLKTENTRLEQEYQKMKQIHDYKCHRTDEHDIEDCLVSMGYNSDYWKNENGYGNDGDKIIDVK